ncbi:DUF998 domain-containing protein [Lentzea sp. NPDC005914]|uniref:DUF998 domain-containing protein n=1 Tax=Lentzea sp. NPDC005914 TaxID=3154572 RepID=UPI003402D661
MNRPALCGVIAGPLFVLTFLVNGALVAGYSPLRHPVSSLQLASWVQSANFVVTGVLIVAFAVGTRPGFWGTLLIGAVGAGLVGSGIFTTDPVSGYPPGSPALSDYTWHGQLHDLFAIPTFVGWPIACFVLARRFRPLYSIATGVAFVAMFVLTNAAFAQTPGLVEFGGLFQRLTITIGFTWLTLFSASMLVKRPDLD